MLPLAQPPKQTDRSFDDWMYRMWQRINIPSGISWTIIDKTGAHITDIPDALATIRKVTTLRL